MWRGKLGLREKPFHGPFDFNWCLAEGMFSALQQVLLSQKRKPLGISGAFDPVVLQVRLRDTK